MCSRRSLRESRSDCNGAVESLETLNARSFVVTFSETHFLTKTLDLPEKFISIYGEELSGTVRLIDPVRNVWQVNLTKIMDYFWFDGDWDKFVKHHSIALGYVLAFKYEGKCKNISNFSVSVFDNSACEIQYSCYEQHATDDKNGSQPHCPTATKRQLVTEDNFISPIADSLNQQGKKCRHDHNSSAKGKLRVEHECQRKNPTIYVKKEPGSSNSEKGLHNEINDVALQGIITTQNFSVEFKKATLKTKKAVLKACESNPSNASFMVILKTYNIIGSSCYMYVPAAFSKEHLQDWGDNMQLEVCNGEKYCVSVIGGNNESCRRVCLSGGWVEFSKENDLKEGDVCLFEVLPSASANKLKVSIFHANDFV